MTDDYLAKAELNLINVARQWQDAMSFCDALESFGNKMCNEYIAKGEFFSGLKQMRHAMYLEYANALSRCFYFAGVGGEEAKKFSREKLAEIFDEKRRYVVMHFLDANLRTPSSWADEDEDGFRREVKSALESHRD